MYLEKHVLICAGSSCGPQDGEAVRKELKRELKARGLRRRIRDSQCTCLGLCREGVNAVIWPEGTYLSGLTVPDVPALVDYLEGKGPRLIQREELAREKVALRLADQK